MKKTVFFLVVTLISVQLQAQMLGGNCDPAVAKFKLWYNTQQPDSIFSMLSDRIQSLMPREKTGEMMKQLYGQFGTLNKCTFSKRSEHISFYKATFDKAVLSLVVSVNGDNRLETFRFVPYTEEQTNGEKSDMVIKGPAGNIYGSLMMPTNSGKVPVVLIVAGSGPTDRNGNSSISGKSNCYRMLADSLRAAGIATVRYDKRGVGESAGAIADAAQIRFDDMVADAVAFTRLLQADARFSKVFILGHSEGSLVGMLAAAQAGTAGFVSLAGIAERADKIIVRQISSQSMELAASAKTMLDSLAKGHMVTNTNPELAGIFSEATQPYLISWLRYVPADELKKLRQPVLILQGTTDLQVSTEQAELLRKACPTAHLKMVKDMNHVLKRAPLDRADNLATYSKEDLPLSGGLVSPIVELVNNSLK